MAAEPREHGAGGLGIGTSGSLRVESHDVVDEDDDDDETISLLPPLPPFCSSVLPAMFRKHRISTGFVPSSSGVTAPRDDGEASGNGDNEVVGDGVEQ